MTTPESHPVDHTELAALRKIAQDCLDAYEGEEWRLADPDPHDGNVYDVRVTVDGEDLSIKEFFGDSECRHIVAFQPKAVHALLDKLEELTAEVRVQYESNLDISAAAVKNRARAEAAVRRVADLEAGITARADAMKREASMTPDDHTSEVLHAHADALRSLLSQSGKGQTEGQEGP